MPVAEDLVSITPCSDGLPATGFVRLANILAPRGPLPISKSSWWEGVRTGRYPQPIKLGPRITAWRCEDIRTLLETGVRI
ncbi:AlpA family phage regulatory protein [Methylobacterium longum]|uniref:AlpA family phage regulatory protein n=1 Tax=Methylobacterium longum TaxID=767694 RepID=A0ABT8AL17_9HYPH|nr:AlpA family phage regulatory protein [Methylobacterium longum]MDN3570166.1 AlpA family phage regulatory protein [Methylobacterium longum]